MDIDDWETREHSVFRLADASAAVSRSLLAILGRALTSNVLLSHGRRTFPAAMWHGQTAQTLSSNYFPCRTIIRIISFNLAVKGF